MGTFRLAGATVALAGLVVLAGCLGASLQVGGILLDPAPIAFDATPATIGEEGQAATGYEEVHTQTIVVNQSLRPVLIVFDKQVSFVTWVSLYQTGLNVTPNLQGGSGDDAAPQSTPAVTPGGGFEPADGQDGDEFDGGEALNLSEVGVATVFTMDALKVGPLSLNPVLWLSTPELLASSDFLLGYLQSWVPGGIADVTVRNSEPVTMLGEQTMATEFAGTAGVGTGTLIDVRLYLARVEHDSDVVIVLAVYPEGSNAAEERFLALLSHLDHGSDDAGDRGDTPTPDARLATVVDGNGAAASSRPVTASAPHEPPGS